MDGVSEGTGYQNVQKNQYQNILLRSGDNEKMKKITWFKNR
jgi:hypothetical protein